MLKSSPLDVSNWNHRFPELNLNLPPCLMSYQSGIHSKMAIFDPKYHAPEPSLGSESASILLVRLFFICQATFTSFDILTLALAVGRLRGGWFLLNDFANRLITSLGPTGNLYQRVFFNQAQSIFKRYFTMIFLSHSNLRLIIMTHKKKFGDIYLVKSVIMN